MRLDVESDSFSAGLTIGDRERILKSVVDSLEFLFTFQRIVIKHVQMDVVNDTIDGLRQLLSSVRLSIKELNMRSRSVLGTLRSPVWRRNGHRARVFGGAAPGGVDRVLFRANYTRWMAI